MHIPWEKNLSSERVLFQLQGSQIIVYIVSFYSSLNSFTGPSPATWTLSRQLQHPSTWLLWSLIYKCFFVHLEQRVLFAFWLMADSSTHALGSDLGSWRCCPQKAFSVSLAPRHGNLLRLRCPLGYGEALKHGLSSVLSVEAAAMPLLSFVMAQGF